MAKGFGTSIPKVSSVPKPKHPNANYDRSTRLRAPRLKQLNVGTRDYTKSEQASEQPLQFQGAGFQNSEGV